VIATENTRLKKGRISITTTGFPQAPHSLQGNPVPDHRIFSCTATTREQPDEPAELKRKSAFGPCGQKGSYAAGAR
jgi:hypothetical protein